MRLFLAIDPGEDCRQRLTSILALLRNQASGGIRWARDGHKLHITLAFLGEVNEDRVDSIRLAMRQVAAGHSPFRASVSGSGVFPDWRRPRVVWLGLHDAGQLLQLGNDVTRICASLGFKLDHPFRAHLTVGRIPQPLTAEQRNELRSALGSLSEAHPFEVTRVLLMQSKLSSAGSEYTELAAFPLGAA